MRAWDVCMLQEYSIGKGGPTFWMIYGFMMALDADTRSISVVWAVPKPIAS